jgi:hypothetical protein
MTLVELLVALAVSLLLSLAIAAFTLHISRSFAVLGLYIDMDEDTRLAFDTLTRDIRVARQVTSYATNKITLQSASNLVTYAYNAGQRKLQREVRTLAGSMTESRVLLQNCRALSFEMYQRNATTAAYDVFPSAATNNCKIVRLTWSIARSVLGQPVTLDSAQSARVVLRTQGK